jgi:hypothetical protein
LVLGFGFGFWFLVFGFWFLVFGFWVFGFLGDKKIKMIGFYFLMLL